MKIKLLAFLCLIILSINIYPQNSFQREISTQLSVGGSEIIEHNNNYYFIANMNDKFMTNDTIIRSISMLYKLSLDNQFLDSLTLFTENDKYSIADIIKLNNDNLALLGAIEKPDSLGYYQIFFAQINQELDVLDIKYYDLNTAYLDHLYHSYNSEGHIIVTGIVQNNPPQSHMFYYDKIILEFDQNGSLLYHSTHNDSSIDWVFDLVKTPNTDQYILYCFPGLYDKNNKLDTEVFIIDENYNIVNSYIVDEDSFSRSLRYTVDQNIITTSLNIIGSSTYLVNLKKYNSDFELLKTIELGRIDTLSYPAMYNSLATNDHYHFFAGYTYNLDINTSFSSKNSFFTLYSITKDLDVNWQKYYGGDAHYRLQDIYATSDNGCIMIGSKYANGANGPYHKTLVVIKTDENGLITSTNEEESIPIKNAIITPNPGKDYLQFHTGIYPATMLMYHINGQLVLEEDINESSTMLNTQNLASGTYVWQLVKDGEVVESGKWVKE